jgi:hypothetical protein
MRATRPRPTGRLIPLLALLASFASGVIACESTPMDMWISMNPEAGADFRAPPRDVAAPDGDDTGTGGSGGSGGSDGTGGTGGAAGDTGSGTAGTTGSGGDGTGGDAGSGGGAGTGGAGGDN